MSVDVRTRSDNTVGQIDTLGFFSHTLPIALDDSAERLGGWIASHELRPIVLDVEGVSATLAVVDGRAEVVDLELGNDGVEGGAVESGVVGGAVGGAVESGAVLYLSETDLTDLVHDQVTPMGMFASGNLRLEHARLGHLLDWWLVIRSALDVTTPYVPGDIDLIDSSGVPLDLQRAFSIDDDPDEMAEFLHVAGYLHIAGVFSEAEMSAISSDMDSAVSNYTMGDGNSWWARLHDGSDALVRMQHFEKHSDAASSILADDRIVRLTRLTGDGHRPPSDVEALFKPVGVAAGISDVPWHKDCSLGRHSYMCSGLTVGISVTGADDTSGQLKVVAGSNRALVWPAPELQPGLDLPVVDLATSTGDVTVHLSCTLHMAQPPVDRPRRVLYTSMYLPPLDESGSVAGASRLRAIREAAPVTVSQPASETKI